MTTSCTGAGSLSPQGTYYYYYHNQLSWNVGQRKGGRQVKNKFFILIYSYGTLGAFIQKTPVLTNEFLESALQLVISLMRDLFHYKECKLFNYLMTGPKKCEVQREACSVLGARGSLSVNTLFIPGEKKNPARRLLHPHTRH